MRRSLRRVAVTVSMSLVAVSLVAVAALPAAASAARVPPASVQGECGSGTVPLVVASDVAAQSDIYSAVTLAGVLGDACIVLAGPRGEAMPAGQRARLDAAAAGGYVVGGQAAVADGKLAGRSLARIAGKDRWTTAQRVGAVARSIGGGDAPAAPTLDGSLSAAGDVGQPGVHLRGAEPWIASDCAGDVPIVVGSDAAAQSDIYSAVTLAGVVGTDCVILAGPRDGAMPASQNTRLEAAEAGGFVLGGIAAVPTAKIAGRDMTRLGGADRWDTAQLVGRRASGDTTAGTSTAGESTATEDPEQGTEDGEPEGESQETDAIPDPIIPNEAWLALEEESYAFRQQCGWRDENRGGYRLCENPEDTLTAVQLISAVLGCEFDLNTHTCKGLDISGTGQSMNRQACPEGWGLSETFVTMGEYTGWLCYRHDHPDYYEP